MGKHYLDKGGGLLRKHVRPGGELRTETNLILVHLLVPAPYCYYRILICENLLEFFPYYNLKPVAD